MTVEGKVAVVTGAGSGLGEAAAKRLAASGAKVAVLGRTPDELEAVKRQIERDGGEAMVVLADISKPDEMEQAMQAVADKWGTIDAVFANAGINGVWISIEDLTPEDWDQTLDINLKGTFLTIKYAVPYLKRQGGSVVVTSSINGTRVFSNTGATAYSTSKAGQVALAKMLAVELAKHKIRVNVICPGAIESEIDDNTERVDLDEIREPAEYPEGNIPLTDGVPGRAEQVGDLVHFLLSDESSHISGSEIWIDGAQSLLIG
ncbi:MAG TPA: SDR family NAD(P)-dependent oxidoreductase [Aggregatilinea sp.]|uniref:SDR family oxidoreductase n=1 Tax=Aggregatilinea sp. TaxID=2806333 RepID=UPI002BC880C9|nr:SDR family NAD(P)-dependent oxidoreductase [Aggregatilinea sp.]HML21100.1 SDR family NAD(P)-dependent oxidoreductase [Aggregatilinea sp.]